ncbi:MAG TPA: hypothetical protein VJT71_16265, partial [Pyrinomonadaceae bacterium]|nr:hypothetical protein [Pyrinomonadaceae bacterium]
KIGGRWRENKQGSEAAPWEFELKQTFQAFKGTARRADQEFKLQDTKLEGEHIRFRFFADGLTRAELNGIVKDDVIEGTLVLHKSKTEKKQPFSMKRIPDVNLNTPQPTAP